MKKHLRFACEFYNLENTHKALLKGASLINELEKLGIHVQAIGIIEQYDCPKDFAFDVKQAEADAEAEVKPVEPEPEVEAEVIKKKPAAKKPAPKAKDKDKAEKPVDSFEMPEPLEANMSNAEQIAWIKQLNSSIEAENCSSNDVSVCLRLHAAVHDIKVTKALLSKMGYEKPSEIPEEKAASFIALFFDNVIRPDVDADACSDEEEDF